MLYILSLVFYILLFIVLVAVSIFVTYMFPIYLKDNWASYSNIDKIFNTINAILSIIVLFLATFVVGYLIKQNIDNQKYFEHQYKYVNTISVDPYENKTIMNNSDKEYIIDGNGIFDVEDGTILPGYDYTYRNKSGSRKNFWIFIDINVFS